MDVFKTLYSLKFISFLKKWNLLNFILGCIDSFAIVLAFQLSYFINYYEIGGLFFTNKNILFLFLVILPFWLLILYMLKVTEIPRTKRYRVLFLEYLQSATGILFLLIVFYFVFKLFSISRRFILELPFFGFLFLFIVRMFEYKVFKTYRSRGYNSINIVLIADDSSVPFIERLIKFKEWGYKIVGIFTDSALIKEKYEKSIIMISENYFSVLNDLMEAEIIDEVMYIKKKVIPDEVRETVRYCEVTGVTFRLRYREQKINLTNAINTEIAGERFLTFTNIPHNPYALAVKTVMDINISLLLIIILLPVFIIISILIKLTSKGPVIYKQARVGLRGRLFNMYKFRTMVIDADKLKDELISKNEMDHPVFKIDDDPRIIGIGRFLRRTGLDELPQLFNVFKGEMSLIGPRPPLGGRDTSIQAVAIKETFCKARLIVFLADKT